MFGGVFIESLGSIRAFHKNNLIKRGFYFINEMIPKEAQNHKVQNSGKVLPTKLSRCLKDKIQTSKREQFLKFCQDFVKDNKQNELQGCHHLFKYTLNMIDSLSWPITSRQFKRLIELQKRVMEENFHAKSNFVVKEGLDFGSQNYYSRVAFTVQKFVKSRGYDMEENSDLVRDKKILSALKKDMLREKIMSNESQFKIPPLKSNKQPQNMFSAKQSPKKYHMKCPKLKKYSKITERGMAKPPQTSIDSYFYNDEVQKLKSSKSQCSVGKSL